MYQNPSLVYSYDPWTNTVIAPPPSSSPKTNTSSEVKKKDTNEVKKKDTKPDVKKKDVISKIKKEESTTLPPLSPTREKKRDVKPSRPPTTTAVPTKFSWQKMFTNAWDFLKMPFEE
jgi:hypothetical protein